jgi:hypothetical protein
MNEKIMMSRPSSLAGFENDGGRNFSPEAPPARPETVLEKTTIRQEKIAARRKAFDLILSNALSGSRPYVESYRAGRGAE